ncbi:MAG: metal ABC transporter ATP-binding protein [Candidatus Njordarchaeota archaeon]
MRPAIEAKNVFTTYPKSNDVALKNININIPYKTITLITGPNGAGKTSLLELILGFLKPIRGSLYVLGMKMPKMSKKIRKMCSYVAQNFMKPPNTPYTSLDVIIMGLAPYKGPFETINKEEKEYLRDIASFLGIEDLLNRPFGTLSGGQQQRIMLARALIRRPILLLLDEPFSSIDRETRVILSSMIHSIKENFGTTIIVVSHDVKPIIDYADGIIKMKNGRIVEEKWN